MTLANKQNLAELRKKFCIYAELDAWYNFIEPFLHSDGKVVTIKKRLPLVKNIAYISHITVMCCYSALGVKVPLFIVLQNLQNTTKNSKIYQTFISLHRPQGGLHIHYSLHGAFISALGFQSTEPIFG